MRYIDELDVGGARTFIRADLNVPLDGSTITDTTRIEASLPTIRWALDHGAIVIVASHLGRPKGTVDPALSLRPIADSLSEFLQRQVMFAPDCIGDATERLVRGCATGDVVVLENLRFHPEEAKNDAGFARQLAALADVYVNDAFGAAHRAHASTEGMAHIVPQTAAGLLIRKEVEALSKITESPERPLVAILGGAKVSDKINVIENLLTKVDALLIGGAMAYTFLRAQGHATGKSLVEEDRLDLARTLLERAQQSGVALHLPSDHVVSTALDGSAPAEQAGIEIPDGTMGVDIGPATSERYGAEIAKARTVLWNGPMGIFEVEAFSAGTMAVADAMAKSPAMTVVGGGDSIAALSRSGKSSQISHISTGGGAALEFLEGRTLPGLAVLNR